jgi:hypothetical protein
VSFDDRFGVTESTPKDIPEIKKKILDLIGQASDIVTDSDEEELCCLNIDWVCLSR